MTVLDIPTPALVVDVAAMERNIRRMAAFCAAGPCRLRPHFKAHKTPEIARRQLAAGALVRAGVVGARHRDQPAGRHPHDVRYAIAGDRVVDIWRIAARGYAEQRSQLPITARNPRNSTDGQSRQPSPV